MSKEQQVNNLSMLCMKYLMPECYVSQSVNPSLGLSTPARTKFIIGGTRACDAQFSEHVGVPTKIGLAQLDGRIALGLFVSWTNFDDFGQYWTKLNASSERGSTW